MTTNDRGAFDENDDDDDAGWMNVFSGSVSTCQCQNWELLCNVSLNAFAMRHNLAGKDPNLFAQHKYDVFSNIIFHLSNLTMSLSAWCSSEMRHDDAAGINLSVA